MVFNPKAVRTGGAIYKCPKVMVDLYIRYMISFVGSIVDAIALWMDTRYGVRIVFRLFCTRNRFVVATCNKYEKNHLKI